MAEPKDIGVDDLINNVINNVTDPQDAIDAVLDMVTPIQIGARVIVSDVNSEYYGVIGDVINQKKGVDDRSGDEIQVSIVKVIRPMLVPQNSTDPATQADMGSEIEVPSSHLALLTSPNGSSVRNTGQGASSFTSEE